MPLPEALKRPAGPVRALHVRRAVVEGGGVPAERADRGPRGPHRRAGDPHAGSPSIWSRRLLAAGHGHPGAAALVVAAGGARRRRCGRGRGLPPPSCGTASGRTPSAGPSSTSWSARHWRSAWACGSTWSGRRRRAPGSAGGPTSSPRPRTGCLPAELTAAAALEHLVRRHLGGFGPSTPGELADWAGLPVGDVAPVLERLPLRRFGSEDGHELFDLPDAPGRTRKRPHQCAPCPPGTPSCWPMPAGRRSWPRPTGR